MTQPDALKSLLDAVAAGSLSSAAALDKLKHFDIEPVGDFARVDRHRSLRTGFPEVIWGPGKTPEQIAQLMNAMRPSHPTIMATRIEPAVYAQLQSLVPDLVYYELPRICALLPDRNSKLKTQNSKLKTQLGLIGVLSAGTADLPVAEEAALTAELSGFMVKRLWDVGVAGIHRLLSNRQVLDEADVLIVVAGMEGALPSVVAGLVECPAIAVPTSVGYGTNFGGLAPLLTMLNSCAPGIAVMNIDNGFGAAIVAGKMLRTAKRLAERDRT